MGGSDANADILVKPRALCVYQDTGPAPCLYFSKNMAPSSRRFLRTLSVYTYLSCFASNSGFLTKIIILKVFNIPYSTL